MAPMDAVIPTPLISKSEVVVPQTAPPSSSQATAIVIDPPPQEEDVCDVPYFRQIVVKESSMLNELCGKWEKITEELVDVSEDGRHLILCAFLLFFTK